MYTSGSGDNHLMVLCDARTKSCYESGGVLDFWGAGNRFLGRREWGRTLRVAVRDYKQPPLHAKALKQLRPELDCLIRDHGIKAVLILQSPPSRGGDNEKVGTNAWRILGGTGSLYGWSGTAWRTDGPWLAPSLNPAGYDWVYHWLIRRWFIQALAVAQGRVQPRVWPTIVTAPGPEMLATLQRIAESDEPLAVDIETSMGGGLLSAIGLGTRSMAVSIPWQGYPVTGKGYYEPGIEELPGGIAIRDLALSILKSNRAKIGHNLNFDIFQLRNRKFDIGGEIHDTLLMARSVYPQYRRGLQQVAAMEYCTEPWKSLWKPPSTAKKAGDIYLADPQGMRLYNCKDVVSTAWIFDSLERKLA